MSARTLTPDIAALRILLRGGKLSTVLERLGLKTILHRAATERLTQEWFTLFQGKPHQERFIEYAQRWIADYNAACLRLASLN